MNCINSLPCSRGGGEGEDISSNDKQLESINIKREMMNTNTGYGKNAYAFHVRESIPS